MRSKRLVTLAVIGMISITGVGGYQAYAQVINNKISKNKVMTESLASTEMINKEVKESALNAFKNYFNEEVDVENLYERVILNDLQGQKTYNIIWTNQKGEYIDGIAGGTYCAVIDSDTNKVLHLEARYGEPKNEEYKNYSYNDAKTVATKFIKESKIIGENYILLEDESKELNQNKNDWDYLFYFQYDQNKKCLINVRKDSKRITNFLLFDEMKSVG